MFHRFLRFHLVKKMPLSGVLIIPFVLQIGLAVTVVGYFSFKNGQQAVNDLANQLMGEVSNRISQRLDAYVPMTHQVVELNLAAIELGILDVSDLEKTGQFFWQQMKLFNLGYLSYGTPDGEFIGIERLDDNRLNIVEVSRKTGLGKLHYYEPDDQGNRAKLIDVIEYNFFIEAWYADTVKLGKPNWSSIYQWDDKPEVLSIAYNHPIYEANNQLKGVINADLILSQVNQFLQDLKISPSGKMFIIEPDGMLVASSSDLPPFQINEGVARRIQALESRDGLIQATARYLQTQFPDFAQITTRQELTFKVKGKSQFIQVTPWHEPLGLDWLIVTVVPESDFMAQIHRNTQVTILLCLGALAIAMTVGVFSARWISQPILRLKKASEAITSGNLEERVTITGINELEALARAFNSMTQQLEESMNQLETQNQELQRLDQLKDEFLANTSHELRTPLNGIIGLAESLIDGATGILPAATCSNLAMIISSGRRLTNLINDILDFSKLQHHTLELQLKPIDLWSITNLVLTLSQSLTTHKNLELINAIPRDFSPAEADENRLQQILYNLIGNAIKFTEAGAVEISAEVHSSDGRDFITVRVADTGIGIPADKFERIFISFEQGDGSTARQYGGTGLGLSVTKQLVELHGGQIWVESEVGVGSKFYFTVPVSAKSAETAGTSLSSNTELALIYSAITQAQFTQETDLETEQKLHILVVDDEPINLQVLQNHLSLSNYRVTQALSGQEALTALERETQFDLILLDVMMPNMSGYEVCAKVREKHAANFLPIIMLTAKNQTADLIMGFQFGANDYLTKPFVKDELLARIKTHIQLSKISNAYGRFVPHEYLGFLQRESILDVSLGDHVSKEMAILFSDIRSFTSLSETMTPQESFNFINAYLQRVSPRIRQQRGLIVKFLGDGIMAVFPNGADDAVQAGIIQLQEVEDYNLHREAESHVPIRVGIGIHLGHIMVGIVGDAQRMEGDILSDHVNLTARLEGLTKFYGASLLISGEVFQRLKDSSPYQIRFLDRVIVRGKTEPIAIYEVMNAEPESLKILKLATQAKFQEGIEFYRQRQFQVAQSCFAAVLAINPQDQAAQLYLERVQLLQVDQVPEDWDGVWQFTEK